MLTSQHRQPDHPRWRIARLALASRIFLLLAMSLSCSILPDFHPGDDVLQFDLRLTTTPPQPSDEHCFCLQGHGCDAHYKSRRRIEGDTTTCADVVRIDHDTTKRYVWLDQFYAFILPPVTKWDAARFLTLSVDPWARYPPHLPAMDGIVGDGELCNSDDMVCKNDDTQFASSEQAHAFFPLVPLAIRYTANLLLKIMPENILPSTYEATAAMSAIAINIISFVLAAVALYDLTIFMLKRDELENKLRAKENDTIDSSNLELQNESSLQLYANTAALLFCINPAGVFFTAAYSESIFSMLTFGGHAIAARGQYYNFLLLNGIIDRDEKRLATISWWWAALYWIPTTILWMMASYTRSNGTFSSIWWLLVGVAEYCFNVQVSEGRRLHIALIKCVTLLLFHGTLALLVACPVLFHDWRGYNFHCHAPTTQQSSISWLSSYTPRWCDDDAAGSRFSLYGYVQRRYWNVGLFRYYELKQVPNFILALPILMLSFAAAGLWIVCSWDHLMTNVQTTRHGRAWVKDMLQWTYLALGASYAGLCRPRFESRECINTNTLSKLLLGPMFLSYYAILAGFAMVGTCIAHVQISTRLICSSCPALYWFMSTLVVPSVNHGKEKVKKSEDERFKSNGPILLYSYFALFNIVGVIMHVNWLPWT